MASLVIFMQLRYLFHEVQKRIRRHKNYLRVINNMEARFVAQSSFIFLHTEQYLYLFTLHCVIAVSIYAPRDI